MQSQAEKAEPTKTIRPRKTSSRSAGEGTYYRDGEDYCWRLRKGPRNAQTTVAFAREKSAAALKIAVRRELGRIDQEGERKRVVDKSSVAHALDVWIDTKVAPRRDQNTTATYRHQLPRIKAAMCAGRAVGGMRASEVGFVAAQAVLDHYAAEGLGVWSQLKGLQVLTQALRLSVKDMKEAGLNVPKEPEGRDRVLSEEEFADFLAELFREREVTRRGGAKGVEIGYRDRYLVAFVLNTGLRINEALGTATVVAMLGKRSGILDVASQLKRVFDPKTGKPTIDPLTGEQAWILDATKGDQKRKVPLNAEAIAAIEGQLAMIEQEKAAAGEAYRDNGILFPTSSGRPHRERNVLRTTVAVQKRINERRVEAGLDPYEPWTDHDLRRTYATYLASVEDNISIVADILGHRDIETTRKHYVHAQEKGLRETGAKVSFGRKTG